MRVRLALLYLVTALLLAVTVRHAWGVTDTFPVLAGESTIEGTSAVYATARSTSTSCTGSARYVGQNFTGAAYFTERSLIAFDTSSIPDTDVITAVTLTAAADTDNSTTDFTIEIQDYNWSFPVCTDRETNYDGCLSAPTDAAWRSTAGIAINTSYTSAAMSTSWVNKTGETHYCLLSDRDIAATTPTGAEYVIMASGGLDFTLSVTHQAADTATPTPTETPTPLPTHTATHTPTLGPSDCCQCGAVCAVPAGASCSSCTPVYNASCIGGVCGGNTPTPTITPTPTLACSPGLTRLTQTRYPSHCTGAGVWATPTNAEVFDNIFATLSASQAGVNLGPLICDHWGFTIPAGSTITDIQWTLQSLSASGQIPNEGSFAAGDVRLMWDQGGGQTYNGPPGNTFGCGALPYDLSCQSPLPSSVTNKIYDGGLWGGMCTTGGSCTAWDATVIDADTFGMAYMVLTVLSFNPMTVSVDAVQMSVEYCAGDTPTPTATATPTITPTLPASGCWHCPGAGEGNSCPMVNATPPTPGCTPVPGGSCVESNQ